MYVGVVGVFCILNLYYEYDIRILCTLLYIGTYFKDRVRQFSGPKIENVPRSVNTFHTNCVF